MKKLSVVLAATAFAVSLRADSTWIGAATSTDPDAWNVGANWSGGVPTGSVNAKVDYSSSGNTYVLHFTPPLDFTGVISVSRDSTDWDVRWPNYLKLTVLEGATWTVGGSGHLIATEGIAARIGSTFTGTVVIPPDMSFTAASTLNSKIQYSGKGTLVLTTTNQLSHISGFTGTLVWNGPEGASLTPVDMAVLQQRGIRLGNGASVNLRNRYLSINGVHEIPDWNEAASDWSFNGTTTEKSSPYDLDMNPPHANAAGELELVNDAAQNHSVFYKGCRFRMHDSWGVSFRWKPGDTLPQKYIDAGKTHDWSGMFGFYLVADPTTYGTLWQPGGSGHGFALDFWQDWAGWQLNKSGIGVPFTRTRLSVLGDGFDFYKESDVDITCQNGLLTVTMTQGDKMISVQRPTFCQSTTMKAVPDGYYIGWAASSDYWANKAGMPLVTHTIGDFRGWYRARTENNWKDVSTGVYPFTAANCTARIYSDTSTYVENAAALESDGSFRLESYAAKSRNILRSGCPMDRNKRYLIRFDLESGTGTDAENTEYTKLGFVKCNDTLSSWVFNYQRLMEPEWDGYAYPLMMTVYWYNGFVRFWADDRNRANRAFSTQFATPKMVKNTTTHVSFLYDGKAGVYYQAHSGKHSLDLNWIPPAYVQNDWFKYDYPVRFQISHASSWGRVDTVLKNYSVQELGTPDTGYVDGEIAVAPASTAVLNADASAESSSVAAARVRRVSLAEGSTLAVATDVSGSRVQIESVEIEGSGAVLSSAAKTTISGNIVFSGAPPDKAAVFSGDVTFADGTATVVVPGGWRGGNVGEIPLFTLASTSSGVLPESYRIVTDSGRDVTGKAFVRVSDGTVSLAWTGFVFTVR